MRTLAKAPWHYWVITILAILWMSGGAYDYLMTQGGNVDYLANFSEAERALFTGFPKWVIATWALSIWSGVLGAVLLVLRTRFVIPLFAFSFVFFAITAFHNYVLLQPSMADVVGSFAIVFSVVIALVILGLWWYAKKMQKRGVIA